MSKKQRTAEQSRLTNICSLCQDKHKDALMCTCEKWFCADCLQNETNEWPQHQDETSLVSRVSVCTHCGLSTLCSLCAIAAFYQGCTSSTSLSKMTWYCLAHRPTQETTPYWSVVRSATLTPESSDYESEVFDVGCSDEDFPDWSEFCVIPNISLSQCSPSSSPAY